MDSKIFVTDPVTNWTKRLTCRNHEKQFEKSLNINSFRNLKYLDVICHDNCTYYYYIYR